MTFPDGTNDTILLTPATINNSTTPCLFTGDLASGSEATIAVAGCRHSPTTTLSLAYNRLLLDYIIGQGETRSTALARAQDYNMVGWAGDTIDYLRPPPLPGPAGYWRGPPYFGPLPSEVVVKTRIVYDRNLLDHFQGRHDRVVEWIDTVLTLSQPRLAHSSLRVKVRLALEPGYAFVDIRLPKPSLEHGGYAFVDMLADANRKYKALIHAFTYHDDYKARGLALNSYGEACSTDGSGTAMSSFGDSELYSSVVYAHELGHMLGMK